MIKTLAHVCILSADLDRTLEFYVGLLGLRKKFDFTRRGEVIGFYLEISAGQYVEVFQASVEQPAKVRLSHFCLEVDDMDATRESLLAAGVPLKDKKIGCDQSWQFWCKDPDGIDLEFHQYTPNSAQLTGKSCEVDW